MSSLFIFFRATLIAQRVAVRHLGAIRFVNRLAKFAAINFRLLANERFDFFRVVVPALQVAAAKFAFRVFFIASALRGFLRLHFGRSGRFGFGGNSGCGGRSSGGERGGGRGGERRRRRRP